MSRMMITKLAITSNIVPIIFLIIFKLLSKESVVMNTFYKLYQIEIADQNVGNACENQDHNNYN